MSNVNKKKADCTPEEWERHLEYSRRYYERNREKMIERHKVYNRTEAVKEKRRAYDMRPEVTARRKARQSDPEYQKALWQKIKADPAQVKKKLESTRKHRTGMCAETFDALRVLQDDKCGVCSRPFEDQQPRADHCHDGKQPRGLLCHHCNIIEGMVRSLGLTPIEFGDRLHDYISNSPFSRLKKPESQY